MQALLPGLVGVAFLRHSNKRHTDQLEDMCKRVLQLGQEFFVLAMFGEAPAVNQDNTR